MNTTTFRGSLGAGLAGAAALTGLHQLLRGTRRDAPRMDVLGREGLERIAQAVGPWRPDPRRLQAAALAGDLVANAAWYALAGAGPRRTAILRGVVLGAAAGIGAVVLPPRLGLSSWPSRRSGSTRSLAFLLYLAGGLVAGTALAAGGRRA